MAVVGYPISRAGITRRGLRNLAESNGIGVVDIGDLVCVAGSGLATNVASGRTRLRPSQSGVYKGVYEVWNDSTFAITHAAGGANPRIDSIVARINDIDDLGNSTTSGQLDVLAGTATSGATLDNRSGAATPSANEQVLYDVLVPAAAASSASFTYRDRRAYANPVIPRSMSSYDGVAMAYQHEQTGSVSIAVAATNYQGASLAYLSRPITATRLRWTYSQGSTAATGNYVIAIYDASGRRIVDTGSIAFTGASNTRQPRAETISSTRFEPGPYYVLIGTTIATGGSSVSFTGAIFGSFTGNAPPPFPGVSFFSTTGGITPPTTLAAMTDSAVTSMAVNAAGVPQIALSTS